MSIDPTLYTWVILPLLIFLARVIDVTLQTMRIIFVSRGTKHLAPLIGFVEVLIWIAVISQIVRVANNFIAYLAYAAGFAAGNFVGMLIEERLALGNLLIRVIVQNQVDVLVENLRSAGYGVTCVAGEGASGQVHLIYTIVKRRDSPAVLAIIHKTHPNAFLSVEEVRSTQEGIFPSTPYRSSSSFRRKAK